MDSLLPESDHFRPRPNHPPVLLASAVSALVFLTLGFFLGRNFSPNQPRVTPNPTLAVSPTPTATIPGWKIIDGDKYNFIIEVPTNYSSDSSYLKNFKIMWPSESNKFSDYAKLSANDPDCCFRSAKLGVMVKEIIIEIGKNTSIDDWLNYNLSLDNHPPDESQIIFTQLRKTIKYSTREKVERDFSDSSLITGFVIESGRDVISFKTVHFPENKKEVKDLFDQILSTFKFTSGSIESKYSCSSDADCGVNICECEAMRNEYIQTRDKICDRYCPGQSRCVANRCVLN